MKPVLSVSEAAEVLGVSDDLIYELTQRGQLPCLRLGRRKLIPVKAIEAAIEHCLDGFELADAAESPSTRTIRAAARRNQ